MQRFSGVSDIFFQIKVKYPLNVKGIVNTLLDTKLKDKVIPFSNSIFLLILAS